MIGSRFIQPQKFAFGNGEQDAIQFHLRRQRRIQNTTSLPRFACATQAKNGLRICVKIELIPILKMIGYKKAEFEPN